MAETFDETAWLQLIAAQRDEARIYYMHDFNWRGSPLPAGFGGPRYYPPARAWRVEAKLDREAPGTGARVELLTSIGDIRPFDLYGTFLFTIGSAPYRLSAYKMVPDDLERDYLFVPFKDATSGKETYGAGRYLDVARQDSDNYLLDFNMAYNPSCAYSPRYNCPYPPPENHLKLSVEAGERVPFDAH